MDDLDDPAALWTAPAAAKSEPRRWVWAAMEPPERRERMRELALWVDWLRRTFELHNQIPACWYLHPPVVEHLTALYVGWVRTYADEQVPGRGLAEADWINTLHVLVPHLKLPACATGLHQAPPTHAPPPPGAEHDFEFHLLTSEATTTAARHPAEAELRRPTEEVDPLL
ncbi:hypothetical protein ABCR94_03380 [Streptomyces sp. 21So2-11]|uniref:hypothetical protein n=1 Tax=Streptomyces sp. 21So2-11 TaxID=3144408 RepID=UPI00321BE023